MAAETKIWQPIDPEFEHKLDAEYVKFHKTNLVYRPRADQIPWSPATRDIPAVIGTSDPLPVGSIVDYNLSKCKIRVFTPEGESPADGWPVFIFFHGGERWGISCLGGWNYTSVDFAGGWTLGNISTENSFSSNMCKRKWSPDR